MMELSLCRMQSETNRYSRQNACQCYQASMALEQDSTVAPEDTVLPAGSEISLREQF